MVGAALFALGSCPAYSQWVPAGVLGVTFVVGSVFFTCAAFGQLRLVGDRWWWQPRSRVWRAGAVQLIGTVLFNLSTSAAMGRSFTPQQEKRLVWAPDMYGSVAFLVASHLAWLVVCRRLWCVRREDADWWVALLNYVGSVFFMVSALASYVLPTTGEAVNIAVVNAGTFLGAVCFLVGAYLLLPARAASHTRT